MFTSVQELKRAVVTSVSWLKYRWMASSPWKRGIV